jgi:uncharacterized membrane-anchored protein
MTCAAMLISTAIRRFSLATGLFVAASLASGHAAYAQSAPAASAGAAAPAGSAMAEEGIPADVPPEVLERMRQISSIDWKRGPTTGDIKHATINVPEGAVFADGAGTRKYLELNHNPTNGEELGMVAAEDLSWFVIFDFSDIGYVKDDEKDEIDADAILKSLREGTEEANKIRKQRGWDSVSVEGWASMPKYELTTHNLEWATKLKNDKSGGQSINHDIRILGRGGVMNAGLVVAPENYAQTLPSTRKLLEGFSFKDGKRYSEFKPGDKVAEIGLIGLMTGGAVAVAAKTGILAKLGKGVFKLGAAVLAGLGALFSKLFGRKKDAASTESSDS